MMAKPCNECPFLREGGVRVTVERAREIVRNMLSFSGGSFACHKTTNEDEDGEYTPGPKEEHCAGAAIFAEKNGNQTQMMRIADRLGMYDPVDHEPYHGLIFDTPAEMYAVQLRRGRSRRKAVAQ